MGPGSIILNMATSGAPIWAPVSDLTAPTGTGFGPMIMNGCGYRTIPGAGRLFTTAVGFTMIIMAGFGNRDMTGRQPGFAGAAAVIIMAGRHWDHTSEWA